MNDARRLRPTDRGEQIASARLSGLAGAHHNGRLDEASALAEMRAVLAEHRITEDRGVVVVSDAASHYVNDPYRARWLCSLPWAPALN